jgi:hypothetical protein
MPAAARNLPPGRGTLLRFSDKMPRTSSYESHTPRQQKKAPVCKLVGSRRGIQQQQEHSSNDKPPPAFEMSYFVAAQPTEEDQEREKNARGRVVGPSVSQHSKAASHPFPSVRPFLLLVLFVVRSQS